MQDIIEVREIQKMLNTKISDCNKCPYLDITEEKQNEIFSKTGKKPNHICTKYNKRVFHMCALSVKQEHSKLFPLAECEVTELERLLNKK